MTQKPSLYRTDHGFDFGAASVSALASDERRGWVAIGVDTAKHKVQIVVSKTGRVRIFVNGMEVLYGK